MLTSKQIEFCKQVANGKNATQAYMAAFKSKSSASSKAAASRLLKTAPIKEKIGELQSVAKQIVEESQRKAVFEIVMPEVMGVAERMGVLTQIARGEIPLKKPMVCDGIIELIDVVPDWMDRKNAIAELNKMDGSYSPTKTDITSGGNSIKSIVIDRASNTKRK